MLLNICLYREAIFTNFLSVICLSVFVLFHIIGATFSVPKIKERKEKKKVKPLGNMDASGFRTAKC